MPNSYTANLNLTLPEVGADTDAWGGHLNAGLTTLDGIFKSDGTGTSVGMKVGAGKTLAVAGTISVTGTASIAANTATINDASDTTKKFKFDASGITTATTRTLTVPDASGTLALTSNTSLVPPGTVLPFAGSSAPSGYLLCYGQAVSRTTYAALFAAIGTAYGVGDTTTTFNLPDLRGRVIAGKDDMGGSAASRLTSATITSGATTLGNVGGAETETASVSGTASVTGTTSGTLAVSATGTSGAPSDTSGLAGTGAGGYAPSNTHTHDLTVAGTTTGTLSLTGTGTISGTSTTTTNVQPSIILNYIIRT